MRPSRIEVREVHDRHGRRASSVNLNFDDGGWNGHYSFVTHDMTPAQVQARHDEILAHHQAKAARMTGFRQVEGSRKFAGSEFEIRIAIVEQGADVRLTLRVIPDGEKQINLDAVYPDVASLPTDAEILTMCRDAALSHLNRRLVGQNHVNAVKQILGLV